MSSRKQFIEARLNEYLDRKEPPRSLSGNHEAQAKEQFALSAFLAKNMPQDGFTDLLDATLEAVEADAKSRFWPTIFELRKAIEVAAKRVGVTSRGDAEEKSPLEINFDRIERGEAVPEEWLFGRRAAQLLRKGVHKVRLDEYRQAALQNKSDVLGAVAAQEWAQAIKQRHHAELAKEADERHQYATGQIVDQATRKKTIMPTWDWGVQ